MHRATDGGISNDSSHALCNRASTWSIIDAAESKQSTVASRLSYDMLGACISLEPNVFEFDEQQLFNTAQGVHILGRTFDPQIGRVSRFRLDCRLRAPAPVPPLPRLAHVPQELPTHRYVARSNARRVAHRRALRRAARPDRRAVQIG